MEKREQCTVRIATPIHAAMADTGQGGDEGEGWKWQAQLIRAGEAQADNTTYEWSPDVVRAALEKFEGARSYMHRSGQHASGGYRFDPMRASEIDLCGWFEGVAWDAGEERITGTLCITKNQRGRDLRDLLLGAWEMKPDIVGLSASMFIEAVRRYDEGWNLLSITPTEILGVNSVDIVGEPAAAGSHITAMMVQSKNEEENGMREKLLTVLKRHQPDWYETIEDPKTATEDEILAAMSRTPELKLESEILETTTEQPDDSLHRRVVVAETKAALAESTLPEPLHGVLMGDIEARMSGGSYPSTEEIAEVLENYIRIAGEIVPQPDPISVGHVNVGDEARDKLISAAVGMFGGQKIDGIEPFRGLKHMYRECGGREFPDGKNLIREAAFMAAFAGDNADERTHYRNAFMAITQSQFGDILGDSLHRVMIQNYRLESLQKWRMIVSGTPSVSDFRNHKRVRMGYYGMMPAVAEGGVYPYLDSPDDEAETLRVAKRGGLEKISFEAFQDDDVSAIAQIPQRIGRGCAFTIQALVFDLFTSPPTMADGKALFHADHANLSTNALSTANASTARVAMMEQRPYGSDDERLVEGNQPKYLLHAVQLDATAQNIAQRRWITQDYEINTVRGVEPIAVGRWTDANMWAMVADPSMIPTIEVGFLNGMQEPQILLADIPTNYNNLRTDTIDVRGRIIFGVVALDWRGMWKSNPAG